MNNARHEERGMTTGVAQFLHRTKRPKTLISLVPMIDVMLILLIFFMVTSTYINLDMIPVFQRAGAATDASPATGAGADSTVMMVRIGADGRPTLRGQAYDAQALERLFAEKIALDSNQQVLILPSGAASMQALVSVMDAATQSGVVRLQIIRLEATP